ncbi:MAG: endolytic transglycosylase MltG [Dethiobacteria bacterium]|jgi:UPF0755 protein
MRRIKSICIVLCIFLAIFGVSAYLACLRINSLLAPVSSSLQYEEKEIVIPYSSSTAQIAAILKNEGMIKNEILFRLYSRYRGYDQTLQAGRYLLKTSMGLEEILQTLQQGVLWEEGLRFTIPEGFTLEQIAVRLEDEGLVGKEAFISACQDYMQNIDPSFSFLNDIPAGVNYHLEGYLFPDTFEVRRGITARELIEVMLHRFNEVFNEDYRRRAGEMGFTLHEIVTLASIVEKEARVAEERPIISAVFHNRLQSPGMSLLQSCATVQYVLGEVKPVLLNEDLEIDSPYNTYLYPYLPPGPIASPGKDALEAALYPAEVDYLYFVYKEDGSGTHYFSTTLQEHNHYKALARQLRH